jgi:integrase
MSEPSFDKSTGWWSIRYYAGKHKPRLKASLLKHPGWKEGQRPPRRVPPEVEALARKYQDLEVQARHGVDITPARPVEVEGYLKRYLAEFQVTRAETSIAGLSRTIDGFVEFCRGRNLTALKSITADTCREFQLHRKEAGKKLSTIVTERALLSPCFRRAAREGLISVNPWSEARIEGQSRQEEGDPVYWTEEELVKLIGHCRGWSRDAAIVAANCGLRMTSLLNLEWRDIDFAKGIIIVRADLAGNKGKRRYDAPMLEAAREVLERLKFAGKGDSPYLLISARAGRPYRRSDCYSALQRATRRAGLPEKGHYNHILRHTFITLALMRGVPLPVVSRWAGHSNIAMTMRYFHACKDESARYTEGLSFGVSPPGPAADGRTPSPPARGPSAGGAR